MEVIADTTLLVDFWRYQSRSARLQPVREMLLNRAILLPWITHGEFLRGACHQGLEETVVAPFLEVFTPIWPTAKTIRIYARTWTALAHTGKVIDYPDLWIAASALERGIPLVTRNRKHFENVPDLELLAYSLGEEIK